MNGKLDQQQYDGNEDVKYSTWGYPNRQANRTGAWQHDGTRKYVTPQFFFASWGTEDSIRHDHVEKTTGAV